MDCHNGLASQRSPDVSGDISSAEEEFPRSGGILYLAAASAARWTKVEQYYKPADFSPAYYATIALQLNVKWHWFTRESKG